jgi:hypothetical protein
VYASCDRQALTGMLACQTTPLRHVTAVTITLAASCLQLPPSKIVKSLAHGRATDITHGYMSGEAQIYVNMF